MFAHQGGWDEMLYIALPVMGALWMLKAAERKARERAEQAAAEDVAPDESDAAANLDKN